MELFKVLVEVRHMAPLYLDNKGHIIEKFRNKYPELDIQLGVEGLEAHLRLRHTGRGTKVFTSGLHTGIETEFEPFDLDEFAAEAEKFCRTVIRDIYKLESVERFGVRFYHRLSAETNDLVGFTLHNLLGYEDDISELNVMAAQWALRFETHDDEMGYNLQFSPDIAETDGEKQFTGHLIADFDSYKRRLPVTAVTSLRDEIPHRHKKALEIGTRMLKGIVQL